MGQAEKSLEINLFGTCIIRPISDHSRELTGTKHKALFTLLATAPHGRRTRSFLQETLWGDASYDYISGRQSLRRALADIRKVLGPSCKDYLIATHSEITLNIPKVQFLVWFQWVDATQASNFSAGV